METDLEPFDRRRRHPDDARTKFERWILEKGGPSVVAKQLGIHYVTVNTWTSRRAIPSLPVAAKILELSQGQLTVQDILDGSGVLW